MINRLAYSCLVFGMKELSLTGTVTDLSLGTGGGGRKLVGLYEALRGGRGGTGGGSLVATMRFWWFFFSSTLRAWLKFSSKPKSDASD